MKDISIYILPIIYMGISAAEDLRSRTISLRISLVFAVIGFILGLHEGRELTSIMQALSIAVMILIISLLTRGAVGIGDAVIVGVCAMYLDAEELLLCVVSAWLMCAFTALFIIAASTMSGRRTSARGRGLPFAVYMLPPILYINLARLVA